MSTIRLNYQNANGEISLLTSLMSMPLAGSRDKTSAIFRLIPAM